MSIEDNCIEYHYPYRDVVFNESPSLYRNYVNGSQINPADGPFVGYKTMIACVNGKQLLGRCASRATCPLDILLRYGVVNTIVSGHFLLGALTRARVLANACLSLGFSGCDHLSTCSV